MNEMGLARAMGAGGADATVADKIVNATPLATEFHADGPPAGWEPGEFSRCGNQRR